MATNLVVLDKGADTMTQKVRKRQRRAWGAVRKLPSGSYQASYTGPDGLRHTAPHTFAQKTLADAWLTQERARIANERWAPPTGRAERAMLFGAYAERVVRARTTRMGNALKPSTIANYMEIVRVPLSILSAKPVAAITSHDVETWYHSLIARGVKTRASRAYRVLSMVMEQAVEDRLIRENPCKVRGAASARTGRAQRVPSRDEVNALAAAMPERLSLAVLLAAYGGLRRGEVLGLSRDAFELMLLGERMTYRVHVRQQLLDVEGKVMIGPTKTGETRVVLLPWHIEGVVTRHLGERVGEDDDAVVFGSTRSGEYLPPPSFAYQWIKARKAAGVEGVRFHDLRHFAGTDVTRAGGTVADAAEKLGHKSIRTAMIYQHETGRQREIAEAISAEARSAAASAEKIASSPTGASVEASK